MICCYDKLYKQGFFKQSLKSYEIFLRKFQSVCRDDQWFEMISIDSIFNPKIGKYVIYVFNKIKKNINLCTLENVIRNLRNKIERLIKKIDKGVFEPDESYYYERELYCYYGIIEMITEGSIVNEFIMNNLKNEFGNNFLNNLSYIDKVNPSKLTKFPSHDCDNINMNDENIQLYLFLKEWQDLQNIYHKEVIIKRHRKLREKFEAYALQKYPYLKEYKKQTLYSLYMINSCPILELEQIAKFSQNFVFSKLSSIIVGKNSGLAKLLSKKMKIPKTFVIPVGSIEDGLYKSSLNNIPELRYAVRSSATVEDGEKYSFAGMFKSILNVSKLDVENAVLEVVDSIKESRVEKYIKKFKTSNPKMAVIVQEFVEPTYSGVWLGNSKQGGFLEYIEGNGEKLVSGAVTPHREDWSSYLTKKNGLICTKGYVGELFRKMQMKLNTISDFEFCIRNKRLIFLQFRPVTQIITMNESNINDDFNFSGIPSSNGVSTGKPIFVTNKYKEENFQSGSILLADNTDPDLVPIMIKSSGIVTAEGGLLCHAAIIARELGLPCITGVGYNVIDILKTKKLIEINGNNGTIKIIK